MSDKAYYNRDPETRLAMKLRVAHGDWTVHEFLVIMPFAKEHTWTMTSQVSKSLIAFFMIYCFALAGWSAS
jgi:hypothetical protein